MSANDTRGDQNVPEVVLCATGCGFYGNPASMNMCSKCYRDHQREQEATKKGEELMAGAALAQQDRPAQPAEPVAPASSAGPASPAVAAAEPAQEGADAAAAATEGAGSSSGPAAVGDSSSNAAAGGALADGAGGERNPVQPPGRCMECNKRLKLAAAALPCRCGYIFCSSHRMAESHNCTFDWKAAGRGNIARANERVVAAKIDRI